MKAIEYLKQIKKMNSAIDACIQDIMRLESLAEKTTVALGGERVQSSGSQEKMADSVVEILDLKSDLDTKIKEYIAYKEKAHSLIMECDAECMDLLYKRYMLFKSWEAIAVEMGYTYQWVSGGLHKRALSQVQKMLDEAA